MTVASSASALARYSSKRTRLRRFRRAQTFAAAACALLTGLAWLAIVELDWKGGILISIPLLVASTSAAAFFHRMWAAVVLRAALWGSFLTASVITIGSSVDDDRVQALPVALAAGIGVLCLGRFSRSLGGARPLLIALAALALADAVTHGLVGTFIILEARGAEESVVFVFLFIAVANIVGLACILKATVVWPHIVGNCIVVGLAALDVLEAPLVVNVAIGGAALLQVALAALLRAPPAPAHVRRLGERALRGAIALILVVDIVLALATL